MNSPDKLIEESKLDECSDIDIQFVQTTLQDNRLYCCIGLEPRIEREDGLEVDRFVGIDGDGLEAGAL